MKRINHTSHKYFEPCCSDRIREEKSTAATTLASERINTRKFSDIEKGDPSNQQQRQQ